MNATFPVTAIHQIEMTSVCNLRCKYCVHPKMPRAKRDMDEATYLRALQWAAYFGKGELNLAGIGESTVHPDFVRFVHLAREFIGPGRDLILATNGLKMDNEMAMAIAPTKIRVWVSLHRPERAAGAVEALRRANILAGVSIDPSVASVDWAGQVPWQVTTPIKGSPCPWISAGRVFVLSDGLITRCCFDATADDVLGSVFDDVSAMRTSAYGLCNACHHDAQIV
jgi:hypothetical protein